jgi:Asp-tRNA(Asn)/Glu-tRNA(Gln) amidotransferase A subunit family amidase
MWPAPVEVASAVRSAINEMKGQGAEVVEVTIPEVKEHMNDGTVQNIDFKFDLNAYLATRPSAPVRTLEEVLASGKYHKAVETVLRTAEANATRETSEYLQHRRMRDTLREAILKVMADSSLDALAYPSIRLKPNFIGEAQAGNNCRLSSNSGLPAIVVPGGFTPDGLPVGVELLGRAWSEPQLIKFAYAYEQATHHRRPPTSTPTLHR